MGLLGGTAGSLVGLLGGTAGSRLSVHNRPLAAVHDGVSVGLECMPAIGPANASLSVSLDQNLQRDARYP